MIIGIDGNEANVSNKVGIGQFAGSILDQLSKLKTGHTFWIYLKNKPISDFPKESDSWKYKIVGPKAFWTQIGLPFHLYTSKKPDVFFSPTHYAPRLSPVPTVIAVMDMSFIHFPELFRKKDLFQLKNWTSYSVRRASRVITISQASKSDIIKTYNISKDRVDVVYPGIDYARFDEKSSMETIKEKYNVPKRYILFVGTLQPRKNIARLIEAFDKVIKDKNMSDLSLVIIGKKGWMYEDILNTPKKLGIEDKVMFLDFVPDVDMPAFYKNAQVFVLPSLYEGFGLPILEAMKYNCPVITSNVSSLPEVGGDAVLYVDPESVDDIAKKIAQLISDEKLREKLIEKGREQIKKFDWEKSARQVLSILEEVGNAR